MIWRKDIGMKLMKRLRKRPYKNKALARPIKRNQIKKSMKI
jgi:hypothetical protein